MLGEVGGHVDWLYEAMVEIVDVFVFGLLYILLGELFFHLALVLVLDIALYQRRAEVFVCCAEFLICQVFVGAESVRPAGIVDLKLIDIDIDPRQDKHSSIIEKIPEKPQPLSLLTNLIKPNPIPIPGKHTQQIVHKLRMTFILLQKVEIPRKDHNNGHIEIDTPQRFQQLVLVLLGAELHCCVAD